MPHSNRRGLIVYPLIVIFVLFLSVLFVERSLRIARLRRDLFQLQVSLEATRADAEALRAELALRDDPGTIEGLARERLGLVKPGEEKIIFVEGTGD